MSYLSNEEVESRFNSLLGCKEFKEMFVDLRELFLHFPNDAFEVFPMRAFLFSVNDGDGLNTQLKLLSSISSDSDTNDYTKIEHYRICVPKAEEILPGSTARSALLAKLELAEIFEPDEFRIMCLDIREWVDRTDSEEFRAVLSRLQAVQRYQMTVFHVPALDSVALNRIREDLCCYMDTQVVYTPPYTVDEYLEYAMQLAGEYDMVFDDTAKEAMSRMLMLERGKPDFWGFKTVRKLMYDLMFSVLRSRYGAIEYKEE